MSRKVKILDCTLRDGGRIINCEFQPESITALAANLTNANIDIVEMGFLRDKKNVNYHTGSTFFTDVKQIEPFISKDKKNTMYVAFIDFNMYDFSDLAECDGSSVTGIRVGFTKAQFDTQKDDIKAALQLVKDKGYCLFVQGVNSLGYSDRELLDLIEFINEIKPYGYGVVDTYGAMYLEDMEHYYHLVDYNLDNDIAIDIHSHNNLQSSFSFAQYIIRLANGKRELILDATLNGMGKGAGNLCEELIVDYLNRKHHYDYDIDLLLDTIDAYLMPMKNEHNWGYSIPAFLSGLYQAHPNNVIYLTQKYRLSNRDIKYILMGIDEKKRQRYDYDNIQKIYRDYCDSRLDDSGTLDHLQRQIGKKVLVMAPGASITEEHDTIEHFISAENPIVISINFVPKSIHWDMVFFANVIHWEKNRSALDPAKCILTSNIRTDVDGINLVDYSSLIDDASKLYDNSTIMLLHLLKKIGVKDIYIAGFDGLKECRENYITEAMPNVRFDINIGEINSEVKDMYRRFKERCASDINIKCITNSLYE